MNEYEKQALAFLEKTNTIFKADFLKFDYHFDEDKQKRNIFKITLIRNNEVFSFNFGSSIHDSCKEVKQAKILSSEETSIYYGFQYTASDNHKSIYFSHSIKTTYPILLAISKDEINLESLLNEDQISNDYNDFLARVNAFNKKNPYNKIEKRTSLDEIKSRIRKRINDAIKEANEEYNIITDTQKDSIEYPNAYDVLTCLQKYEVGTFENFCSDFGYDEDSRKAEKIYKAVCIEFDGVNRLFSDCLDELSEIQ